MKKLITLIILAFCLNAGAQIITTVVGNGTAGYSGDGGQATNAELNYPFRVAFDAIGNMYIADTTNMRIRKVSTTGVITTLAGNGIKGYAGDGGAATAAELNTPTDVAIDTEGNLYITDFSNSRIRKVNTLGIISTFAGTGIAGFSGDGGLASVAELQYPMSITIDVTGNLYIADHANFRIRKINTSGIITTIAGTGTAGYSGDGGQATSAKINSSYGLTVDAVGNIYIADTHNHRIRQVNTLGVISTLAGTGNAGYNGDNIPATSSELYSPAKVAADAMGNVYIADNGNSLIRKVNTAGIITTIAGVTTGAGTLANQGYSGDGGQATSAELHNPKGVTINAMGNLYMADAYNNVIREVTIMNNTTSLIKVIRDNEITICPNPTSGSFQVSLPHSGGEALNIKMFDVVGNEITPILISQKGEDATIEAGSLSNGVYLISVSGGGQSIVKKVIVQH